MWRAGTGKYKSLCIVLDICKESFTPYFTAAFEKGMDIWSNRTIITEPRI